MTSYLIRRILYTIPVLIGITILTFVLFNVVGGDPSVRFAGRHATEESVARLREELGLNKPVYMQYLDYVRQVATLDFGRSWSTQQKISTMIGDGIGATLSLTIPAFIFSVLFCIGLAIYAVYRRGSWFDRGAVIVCLGMMSISSLAHILAMQYFFAYQNGWFPISGWDGSSTGRWGYLVLPWLIMFILSLGPNILIYRTVLMDEIFQDYVRTARAKGLSKLATYFRHVLKNAMIPIVTVIVIEMPLLITGSVLVENFFGIPGIGGIMIQALNNSDFPVIKAMTVMTAVLYMIFNLVSDVLYAFIDPRIKMS